jgi:hypothetical protein
MFIFSLSDYEAYSQFLQTLYNILSAFSDGLSTGMWELTEKGLKFLKFLLLVSALRARFQASFAVKIMFSLF